MRRRSTFVGWATAAYLASTPAQAAWDVETISASQYGQLRIGDAANNGTDRLYGAVAGNRYVGVLESFTYHDDRWIFQPEATAELEIMAFAIGSDCGHKNSLFLGLGDHGLKKVTATTEQTLREGLSNQERMGFTIFNTADVQSLMTEQGEIRIAVEPSLRAPEFQCKPGPWGQRDGGKNPPYFHIAVAGDARGDGVRRFYGTVAGTGAIFELEKLKGRWRYSMISKPDNFATSKFVIADVRNDGHPALITTASAPMEYRWDGNSWSRTAIGGRGSWGALVVGKFRHDGRNRIYTTNAETVVEATFGDDGWRIEAIAAHKGFIYSLVGGRVSGQTESLYFSVRNHGGLYRLSWKAGEIVAVATFKGAGVPAHEADRFTEAIAMKILETGNCTMVERRRIDAILREHNLQENGAFSTENAVRLGKLLGADKVVAGSVGRLYDSYLATVNSVSVKSGLIERSESKQWRSGGDIGKTVENLGVAICPSGQGLR